MSALEQVPMPTPEERRQDIMMDAAGFSAHAAIAATVGFEQSSITVPIPKPAASRRSDHRGGRAYPEGEIDPEWNPEYKPLSPEEIAEREKVRQSLGYRQAHQIAALAEDRAIARRAQGNTAYHLALQRARTERRKSAQ